ncbi:MAG: hypothetical protein ACOZQL_29215 [Myxococcota bacterium]
MRLFSVLLVVSLLAGCGPATPELGKLVSPVITAQRRHSGPLQAILTYDAAKTGCGEVKNLRATFDGDPVQASAGSWNAEAASESDRCQYPGFLLTPAMKSGSREIVFTDDVTTLKLAVSTLELGSAIPDAPPATFRPGTVVKWVTSPPATGTSSWKVEYTPNGGSATTWAEGTSLPSSVSATVPAVSAASSGIVTLSWLVNSTVQACSGASSCSVVVQGAADLNAVVVP